ncbi:MAG: hypothetical protein ACI4O3_05725 [Oscillospiraceae bacterium]
MRVTYEELESRHRELIRDFQAATDGAACTYFESMLGYTFVPLFRSYYTSMGG